MDKLKFELNKIKNDINSFSKELIRIKSFTGYEKDAAELVKQKMIKLGYDKVKIDDYGNVLGIIGNGKTKVLYDAHLDIVEAKDEKEWDFPPFSGEIYNGILHGRGSVDTKSSVVSMIYAGYLIKKLNLCPDKTIYISTSIMEEIGRAHV